MPKVLTEVQVRVDGLGERASDLTDDLEMADDPVLDQLICFECPPAAGGIAFDAGDGFEGVTWASAITSASVPPVSQTFCWSAVRE